MIADIADEKRTVAIEDDTVRLSKLCLVCRSSVSRESGSAGTCNRRNNSRVRGHFANDVAVAFGDIDIPRPVESQFVWHVQGCFDRRSAIASISALAISGNSGQTFRPYVEPSNALVIEVTKIERPVRTDNQTVWIVHLNVCVTGCAGPDKC